MIHGWQKWSARLLRATSYSPMAEPITIYKITILYLLSKSGFPLTNTQIADFFLGKDYTDYFRIQEVLGDLQDTMLIAAESTHKNTLYTITNEGKKTLDFFQAKITDGIKADVRAFFDENQIEFRQENSLLANYDKSMGSGYTVRCQLRHEQKNLVDLSLSVETKEQAEAICQNWIKQNEEVYTYLMDILLK